ncbi:MAG: hypothetical protein COA50_07655 [Flavobacteriaceae bacterium]|nr:MAG: hypothetical protein COA50_07655 [Flavobacteriaceae bacterium]
MTIHKVPEEKGSVFGLDHWLVLGLVATGIVLWIGWFLYRKKTLFRKWFYPKLRFVTEVVISEVLLLGAKTENKAA